MSKHTPEATSHTAMISILHERRSTLVDYLIMKAESEDWHAVADAACDLRELDAKISVLEHK